MEPAIIAFVCLIVAGVLWDAFRARECSPGDHNYRQAWEGNGTKVEVCDKCRHRRRPPPFSWSDS